MWFSQNIWCQRFNLISERDLRLIVSTYINNIGKSCGHAIYDRNTPTLSNPYDLAIYFDWIYILIYVSNGLFVCRWYPIVIYSWTHIQYCLCPARVLFISMFIFVQSEYDARMDTCSAYDISTLCIVLK